MTSTTTPRLHILSAASPSKPTILSSPRTPATVTLFFTRTRPLNLTTVASPRLDVVLAAAKANPSGEQKWTHEGSITESLPNGMFRVKLDNQDLIIGYISGKIRKNFVRILPGDRVKVEVSRYDSSRGRIIYRMRNRDSAND
ncbi:translation initiation factor IF-1, chloroplastic isoform X1 [Ricinus communis]|uniref:translation initiation factor IF-1, chloroplastic isoform X1 n=1 Tax=Ricinus communis TaxID=3988 RepID=UPI000772C666|nr:translation initiation factor IF-1, chloroplastic isoform X1 [Ricinus communis]|eukprot:XP_015579198.1 uncharacterized protein LOC107261831 isoform X1 [Ricinus communis]